MNRVAAHIHVLWGRLWILPLLPAFYVAAQFVLHGTLPVEQVLASLVVVALGYGNRSTKTVLAILAPFVLIAFGADLMRYAIAATITPDRVIGCALRNLELALFGVGPDTTLSDLFAVHHSLIFDLYFAIPYGIFMYAAVVYAGYLYVTDRQRMRHYLLALLIGYAILFAIWFALPTAPPWYIRAHGCIIDTHVIPSAAGLLRVDQALGIGYFQGWNGRGATAFGAMPSMHCAMPVIGLLTAWRAATWRTLPIHLLYAASMIAGSVYLDHHWLIDGLAGWLLAAFSVVASGAILRLASRRDRPVVAGT